jgi:hypothetical protein
MEKDMCFGRLSVAFMVVVLVFNLPARADDKVEREDFEISYVLALHNLRLESDEHADTSVTGSVPLDHIPSQLGPTLGDGNDFHLEGLLVGVSQSAFINFLRSKRITNIKYIPSRRTVQIKTPKSSERYSVHDYTAAIVGAYTDQNGVIAVYSAYFTSPLTGNVSYLFQRNAIYRYTGGGGPRKPEVISQMRSRWGYPNGEKENSITRSNTICWNYQSGLKISMRECQEPGMTAYYSTSLSFAIGVQMIESDQYESRLDVYNVYLVDLARMRQDNNAVESAVIDYRTKSIEESMKPAAAPLKL